MVTLLIAEMGKKEEKERGKREGWKNERENNVLGNQL